MNPWPRRLAYALAILVWLVFMSIPFFAFSLAARQQLQLGSAEDNHIRIFLIQEKSAEGIGLEITRPVSSTPGCAQTSVDYFMWSGEPENVTYCQCTDQQSGHALSATQGACSSE